MPAALREPSDKAMAGHQNQISTDFHECGELNAMAVG